MSSSQWMWTLTAVVLALVVHVWNDFGPLDIYLPSYANPAIEKHFSDSYLTARAMFRARARAANAQLHALPLSIPDMDLTIDIAVLPGAKDHVLLHMSGTHGVEGFAGSAVQSALLEKLAKQQETSQPNAVASPTIVLVHALNPYGFAQLRRFNEHNVDLNRNYLTPEEFQARAAMDPNQFGYVDVYDSLNPEVVGGLQHSFWVNAARELWKRGFAAVKRATVSGNYHFPQSIFYGGAQREESIVLLEQFLRTQIDLKRVMKLTAVDVHTGLGRAGYDTLMTERQSDMDAIRQAFSGTESANRLVVAGDASDEVSQGYDGAVGFVLAGVAHLFSAHNKQVQLLVLTQEFGTVPGPFVLKAMAEENAVYQQGLAAVRVPYAQRVRDVFYLHNSASWKRSVVERGVKIVDELLQAAQA